MLFRTTFLIQRRVTCVLRERVRRRRSSGAVAWTPADFSDSRLAVQPENSSISTYVISCKLHRPGFFFAESSFVHEAGWIASQTWLFPLQLRSRLLGTTRTKRSTPHHKSIWNRCGLSAVCWPAMRSGTGSDGTTVARAFPSSRPTSTYSVRVALLRRVPILLRGLDGPVPVRCIARWTLLHDAPVFAPADGIVQATDHVEKVAPACVSSLVTYFGAARHGRLFGTGRVRPGGHVEGTNPRTCNARAINLAVVFG